MFRSLNEVTTVCSKMVGAGKGWLPVSDSHSSAPKHGELTPECAFLGHEMSAKTAFYEKRILS